MYRQQFYIMANFLIVLDAVLLIATGYMAYSISLELTTKGLVMSWHDFLGSVLVFPACIGSTYTGMILLQVMHQGHAPAAMIVQNADALLVSGAVLAEVWFNKGVPIVEYGPEDLFDKISNRDEVEVDGDTGEIRITRE